MASSSSSSSSSSIATASWLVGMAAFIRLVDTQHRTATAESVIPQESTRHWLDAPPDVAPTVAALLQAIMVRHGWSQSKLAQQLGMHVNQVQRLASGAQRGCWPETRAKIRQVVQHDTALSAIYFATEWGESYRRRTGGRV